MLKTTKKKRRSGLRSSKRRSSKGIASQKGLRTFTTEAVHKIDGCPTKFYNKGYTGRYESRNPVSAAKKAATQLCRVKKIVGTCVLIITVRETTQGSIRKEFTYKVSRKKKEILGPFGNKFENIAKSFDVTKLSKCKKKRSKSRGRKVSRTRKNKSWLA